MAAERELPSVPCPIRRSAGSLLSAAEEAIETMSDRRIVVIHGLSWKPEASVLEARFRLHLGEGLGRPLPAGSLQLAYWADLMEHKPREDEYSEDGERFRPYSFLERSRFALRRRLRKFGIEQADAILGRILEPLEERGEEPLQKLSTSVLDHVSGPIYAAFLTDIDKYFHQGKRQGVKQQLAEKIGGGGPICLVAHSMGSMIAADVLASTDLRIERLITIGSPLGIPVIRRQLGLLKPDAQARLKANVKQWFNLFDGLDRVALDQDLEDDFPGLGIVDHRIENEFVTQDGERNHHKSYGYLRSPRLGQIVGDFLGPA